jgi:GrpB-like predicted nucleotidyltransferase (UPF0157 family)
MMGKPSIDFAVVTHDVLPNIDDELMKELGGLGYEYCGPAPHMMDKHKDHWFFNHHDPEVGYTMHLVSKDGATGLEKLIIFRDYLNSHPDARLRYADVKRKAENSKTGERNSTMIYGIQKKKVVAELISEAD